MTVFGAFAIMETYIFLNVPLTHPYRIMQIALMAVVMIGFVVRKAAAHTVLGALYLLDLLVGQALFRFLPRLY